MDNKISYADSDGNTRELVGVAKVPNYHLEDPKLVLGAGPPGGGVGLMQVLSAIDSVNTQLKQAVTGGINSLSPTHEVAIERVNGKLVMSSHDELMKRIEASSDPKAKAYMHQVSDKLYDGAVHHQDPLSGKPLQTIDKADDFKIPDFKNSDYQIDKDPNRPRPTAGKPG